MWCRRAEAGGASYKAKALPLALPQVHDKTDRLFVGESNYPSLGLTRGLGHRLGHTV